jgi:hypothetical protein
VWITVIIAVADTGHGLCPVSRVRILIAQYPNRSTWGQLRSPQVLASSGTPTSCVLVPSAFSDIHSLYGEAFRLIVEVSDDVTVARDTGDDARQNQALRKMEQAIDLIDWATGLIEELVAERGT